MHATKIHTNALVCCMLVCVCARARYMMHVGVCVRAHTRDRTEFHGNVLIYCMFVFVSVRAHHASVVCNWWYTKVSLTVCRYGKEKFGLVSHVFGHIEPKIGACVCVCSCVRVVVDVCLCECLCAHTQEFVCR